MRREAPLDARGVEEHRDALPFRVPELGLHREERSGQGVAGERVDDVHVLGDEAFAHRRREVEVEAEQIARDLLRVRVDLDHERRRLRDVVARAGDREGIEVVELDRRSRLDERMMHEHGVGRARDEGIRRYEAERVAVDLVLPVDRREVARAHCGRHELGGIDGDVSRSFRRRHGRHAARARATGQPVSRRQSTPR